MKAIQDQQKQVIVNHLSSGLSVKKVHQLTGVSASTISRIRSSYCADIPRNFPGRPPKLSPANVRHSVRQLSTGSSENAVQVSRVLQDVTNTSVSPQTVRRHLKTVGMKAVVKKKRPVLTPKHKRDRLDFALRHEHWTVEDWKRVVWSDETKINRLGSDGTKWAWKRPGEGLSERLVEGTVKFGGGSLMMWGCMLWEGPGFACKIDGKMDADLYVNILEDEFQQSLQYYNKTSNNIIFQHDNDPKHTSKKATQWLSNNNIQTLTWPAQSPDLNPIEHLWHHLKKRLAQYEEPPNGMLELWERVQKEWEGIPPSTCQNLIESMPRRIGEVLKANGGHTKY